MNKRKMKSILLVLLATVVLFGLCACQNLNKTLEDSVSEIHETVLNGKDANFFVEVIGGKIEADYSLDGVKNEAHDFVSVCVRVTGSKKFEKISASFTVKNVKFDEELTQSPFDSSVWTFVCNSTMPAEQLPIVICADMEIVSLTLVKVSSGDIRPLDILKKTFEKELMETFKDGKFNCEISVRLVRNPRDVSDKYYWYVVVYKPDKNFFGLMIDSQTGEIVAKKS